MYESLCDQFVDHFMRFALCTLTLFRRSSRKSVRTRSMMMGTLNGLLIVPSNPLPSICYYVKYGLDAVVPKSKFCGETHNVKLLLSGVGSNSQNWDMPLDFSAFFHTAEFLNGGQTIHDGHL